MKCKELHLDKSWTAAALILVSCCLFAQISNASTNYTNLNKFGKTLEGTTIH